MDDEAFESTVAVISQMPTILYRDALFDYATRAAPPRVTAEDLQRVIESALGLHAGLISDPELDRIKFVEDVVSSLEREPETSSVAAHRDVLLKRLRILLSVESLTTVAKGLSVLQEYPRHLTNCRILTDIRPVFRDDASEPPIGAIIAHSLRLQYHEEGRTHDFFVELDGRDIRKLSLVLQRAIEKEANLKSLLGATGVQYLQLFAEEGVDIAKT